MTLTLELHGTVLCLIQQNRLLLNKRNPLICSTLHDQDQSPVLTLVFDDSPVDDEFYELELPPGLLDRVSGLHCTQGINVQISVPLPSLAYLSTSHYSHVSLCSSLQSSPNWCGDLLILLCQEHSSVWLNECVVSSALTIVLMGNSHLRGLSPVQNCPVVSIQDDQSSLTMVHNAQSEQQARLRKHYCHRLMDKHTPDPLKPLYEGLCCACMTEQATYYAYPCGHANLCDRCFQRPESRTLHQCSLCRASINYYSRLLTIPTEPQLSILSTRLNSGNLLLF